jgi:hypothetical protein
LPADEVGAVVLESQCNSRHKKGNKRNGRPEAAVREE